MGRQILHAFLLVFAFGGAGVLVALVIGWIISMVKGVEKAIDDHVACVCELKELNERGMSQAEVIGELNIKIAKLREEFEALSKKWGEDDGKA